MNCDECKYYSWYYDRCEKYQREVDPREVHNCFEKMETPIRDMMVGINCIQTNVPKIVLNGKEI